MIIRTTLIVAIGWFALACDANAQRTALTPAAAKFLREGPAHVLADCHLERQRCGSVHLVVLDSNDGEANDVARHAEKLSGPGIELEAIFELEAIGAPLGPDPLIEGLTVSTPRWPLLFGLRLGVTQARVRRVLGEPQASIDGCWRYADSPDSVSLCFEGNRLVSVAWSFFVD